MNRKNLILIGLLSAVALFLVWTQASLRAADHGSLQVRVNYTGGGAVDQQHQIYVLLCDANPFTSSKLLDSTLRPTAPGFEPGAARVFAVKGTPAKDGTLTFNNVPVSPVFAVALFDRNGSYDGHLPSLPAGEPMGTYGVAPDKLKPIKLDEGKTVEISLTFGDSSTTP